MTLRLGDDVMVSVVSGVPLEHVLAAWGVDHSEPGPMSRLDWLAWSGSETGPDRARIAVQPRVTGTTSWPSPLLVWETWTREGLREQVARAVTARGGRMLAIGGQPAQARVLYAVGGEVLAVAATGYDAVRGVDPDVLARLLDEQGVALDRFGSHGALNMATLLTGVVLDAQDPDAALLAIKVRTHPFHYVPSPPPPGAGEAGTPVTPLVPDIGPDGPVSAGPLIGGDATGRRAD